jgi:RNA polymerase sigma-70 factor (ECF subfamily)
MPRPDPVLLRAVEGDPVARRALVDRLGPLVWSLCRRLDPDPEDATQEVWEKVLRALPGFDPAGTASLSTWVATIAHRHLVDRHRRRVTRGVAVDPDEAAPPAAAPRPEQARLESALGRLPEDQRRVVVLHHVHGVALEDIAAEEGVALGTVKSRLHRARARLVEELGGRG